MENNLELRETEFNVISEVLSSLATLILTQAEFYHGKPNYSNADFFNMLIIFQSGLMDKTYDNMEYDNMEIEDRLNMAEKLGSDLSKLIHTYTNIDTHNIENYI